MPTKASSAENEGDVLVDGATLYVTVGARDDAPAHAALARVTNSRSRKGLSARTVREHREFAPAEVSPPAFYQARRIFVHEPAPTTETRRGLHGFPSVTLNVLTARVGRRHRARPVRL